jgi:hypothetical protein
VKTFLPLPQQVSLGMLSKVVDRFNEAATELRKADFPRPGTPDEWQRMAKTRHARDYDKLLNAVAPLITAFWSADAGERGRVDARLNPDALFILTAFASYMPVLAVRRESPELITQGLTALGLVGGSQDVRDLTFYLATLHHSAIKLKIDTRRLFGEVASLVPSIGLQNAMRSFPLRSPKDRDLGAFCFRETLTDGKFDLIQDSWDSAEAERHSAGKPNAIPGRR